MTSLDDAGVGAESPIEISKLRGQGVGPPILVWGPSRPFPGVLSIVQVLGPIRTGQVVVAAQTPIPDIRPTDGLPPMLPLPQVQDLTRQ
jgi:hypothetical protein